jgi:RimJ/RimL family protein N-acetyltransferase
MGPVLPAVAPELTGDGILLTPWEPTDRPAIVELADDVGRWWSRSLADVRTVEDAQRWLDERSGPGRIDWAVRDPATRALLGRTSLHRFEEHPAAAEIGYGVHPDHRRRGVAAAAVATVMGYAFGDLGLQRVELVHDTGNTASCSVARRTGFVLEGVERQALGYPDGRVADLHRHARLASDPAGPAQQGRSGRSGIEHVEIAAGGWQLRPPSPEEAEDALVMLTDPLTVRWNEAPGVVDLDSARAWCERGADWSDGSHATFSVLEATTGRLAGNVSLWRVDLADQRSAAIGYRTAPWARGRGVATAGVDAVTRWAFGSLGIERIELPHAVDNLASCRVAVKCGYPAEGVLRGAYRAPDGSRDDEHLHARLSTDD